MAAGGYGFEKSQFKFGGETDRLNYLVSLSDQELDGYRAQSAYENKLLTGRFDVDLGKRSQLADRRQLHRPTRVRRPGRPHGRRRARQSALGSAAERAIRRRRIARAAAPRLRLHDAGRRARHDQGTQLLCVARLRQPAAGLEPGHRRPRARLRRRRRQLQLRWLLARSAESLHRGRRLRRSETTTACATTTSTACEGALGFDQNEHVTSYGVFLQNELSVSERVQLSFGVRFDEVEFEVTDRWLTDGHGRRLRLEEIHGHEPDGRPRRRAHRRLELLHHVFERVRNADDDGVQPSPAAAAVSTKRSSRRSATNFEVGLRGVIGEAQRYEVAVFTIDVEDELIGTRDPELARPVLVRQRRRNDPRRPGVLVDREPDGSHPNHGQLHVLGFHVRPVHREHHDRRSRRRSPQRQRHSRHAREPAVRRVRLSRAARVVRRSRRDLRRRAVRRQRQRRRDPRLHAGESAHGLRVELDSLGLCRRSSASTT